MRTIIDLWEKNPGLWNNDGGYYTALGFLKQKKLVSADSVIRILADSIPTASIRLDKLKKALKDSNYISK